MTTNTVKLNGVPETMLWTLHNRASEALRPDGIIRDPEAVRLYQAIDYDYVRSFGQPDGSHAIRSKVFDETVKAWMRENLGGTVVELGCGLETQFQRCDDGRVQWMYVDVPEALELRRHHLPPGSRERFIPKSALDPSWMDDLESEQGIFVTAQGLFMYFREEEVRSLLITMAERLPGAEVMFDVIPRWFAAKTCSGWKKTPYYTVPRMPWGINRDELEDFFQGAHRSIRLKKERPYGPSRGLWGKVMPIFARLPVLGKHSPAIVHILLREEQSA